MTKNIIKSKWLLVIVFSVAFSIMAIYETLKELVFEGSLTPWQSHTITIIITSLIATLTASIMQSWIISVHLKQKEIESKEKSISSFHLVLSAVNHVMNNVLNYLQLIRLELDNDGKVTKETMKLLEENLQEADKQMKILNQIQNPQDPDSYKNIYPHRN